MRPNLSTASADQRAHLLFHRDVGLAEDASGAEFFGQRLAFRHAAPGDHDFRAFGDENLRGAQPDAARRAGDDRDLAVQPSHVVPLRLPTFCVAATIPSGREQGKRRDIAGTAGDYGFANARFALLVGHILDLLVT